MSETKIAKKVLSPDTGKGKGILPMGFDLWAGELLDHAAKGERLVKHLEMAAGCQPSDVEVLIAVRWAIRQLTNGSEACRELVEANRQASASDEPEAASKG